MSNNKAKQSTVKRSKGSEWKSCPALFTPGVHCEKWARLDWTTLPLKLITNVQLENWQRQQVQVSCHHLQLKMHLVCEQFVGNAGRGRSGKAQRKTEKCQLIEIPKTRIWNECPKAAAVAAVPAVAPEADLHNATSGLLETGISCGQAAVGDVSLRAWQTA